MKPPENWNLKLHHLVLAVAAILPVLTLLACELLPTPPTPAPTKVRPTKEPTPTATAPPTEAPPTVTPAADVCPPPGSPQLIQPANFADYPVAIRQFLSAGGDRTTLRSELAHWDALPDAEDQMIEIDLTGDDHMEIVVALADPNAETFNRPGDLLIFGCRAGVYELLHRDGYEDDPYGPAVRLLQADDVNLDGRPDVAYTLTTCGAHTCWERLKVTAWKRTAFADLMGGVLEMPYPTYTVTPGRIEATSGGIGSVGAEPQRGYAEIWEWNGGVFTVTEQIWEPPRYRYHALLDGDRALLSSDYAAATAAYERVINDEGLEAFAGAISQVGVENERAQLAAFARWRLMLTYLLVGELSDAQAAYNRLQADYPADAAGHPVAAMAETFWSAYLKGESVADACSEVVGAAETNTSVQDFFNANYGYANPWWEPVDLCPFAEQ